MEQFKVKIVTMEFETSWDEHESIDIHTPQNHLHFYNGEPEDATLTRDFNGVYNIRDVIKEAYEAGLAGKEFILEEMHIDSQEEATRLKLW